MYLIYFLMTADSLVEFIIFLNESSVFNTFWYENENLLKQMVVLFSDG